MGRGGGGGGGGAGDGGGRGQVREFLKCGGGRGWIGGDADWEEKRNDASGFGIHKYQ